MGDRERPSVDTAPHPVFRTYSAANFREVAPERLSPAAWSLVGPPMERATRALARRLVPGERWWQGSHYVFVGYFSFRPFHNLSAYCELTRCVPGLEPAEVTGAYFEATDPPPTSLPRLSRSSQTAVVGRLVRELGKTPHRLVVAGERVALYEGDVRRAVRGNNLVALGSVVARLAEMLDEVWDLHIWTTSTLVSVRSLRDRVGRRLVDGWDQATPWLGRPAQLAWETLFDAHRHGLASGDFLGRAFYEVADDVAPWAVARPAVPSVAEPAPRRRRDVDVDVAEALWEMISRPRSRLLRALDRGVTAATEAREETKSLAMRMLHCARLLLPRLAAAGQVSAESWPYLGLSELVALSPPAAEATAARRRLDFERFGTEPLPDLFDAAALDRGWTATVSGNGDGRGLTPGVATGTVVTAAGVLDGAATGLILLCESGDAELQPLLRLVDGVVARRGSDLSHLAILGRELAIPIVVGHPLLDQILPGQMVTIDGSSGEVRLAG